MKMIEDCAVLVGEPSDFPVQAATDEDGFSWKMLDLVLDLMLGKGCDLLLDCPIVGSSLHCVFYVQIVYNVKCELYSESLTSCEKSFFLQYCWQPVPEMYLCAFPAGVKKCGCHTVISSVFQRSIVVSLSSSAQV